MTDPGSRMEHFFERAVSLGSGAALHPAAVLQQVHDAALAAVRDNAVPNAFVVRISTGDFSGLQPHFGQLRAGLTRMLDELRQSRRVNSPGPWEIEFEPAREVAAGQCVVVVAFRNPSTVAPQQGATQAITRYRNLALVVEGLGRVRLTHTPFTIGRASGCDLAIHDLAISRTHARIETSPDGLLWVRDLGSRNKIVSGGEVVEQLQLLPGIAFSLGSTEIVFEVEQ